MNLRDEMEIIWHAAVNKWRDQTGALHVLDWKGLAICGARVFTFAGGSKNHEELGGHRCRRCLRIIERKTR